MFYNLVIDIYHGIAPPSTRQLNKQSLVVASSILDTIVADYLTYGYDELPANFAQFFVSEDESDSEFDDENSGDECCSEDESELPSPPICTDPAMPDQEPTVPLSSSVKLTIPWVKQREQDPPPLRVPGSIRLARCSLPLPPQTGITFRYDSPRLPPQTSSPYLTTVCGWSRAPSATGDNVDSDSVNTATRGDAPGNPKTTRTPPRKPRTSCPATRRKSFSFTHPDFGSVRQESPR